MAELLWGDQISERARSSLRQALYSLRQQLGTSAIKGDGEEIALDPAAISSDRDAFLGAVRASDDRTAVDLYTGPFCDRLEMSTGVEFAHWVEGERERLRRLHRGAVQAAVASGIRDGDATDAVRIARKASSLAPDDSEIVVTLFDALVAIGALVEARERLDAHRAALGEAAREIPVGVRQRLERTSGAVVSRARGTPRSLLTLGQLLVGREDVLATLLLEAERARDGQARRLLIPAPAGMGKSRLLEELEARLRLRGARVVRMRALPAMRDVPLAAITDLLRLVCRLPGALGVRESTAQSLVSLLPELHELYPGVRATLGGEADGRPEMREVLADLLAAVAETRLVVLLLDDLQYADDVSRALLDGAWRDPSLRLLEVWAFRPAAGRDAWGADAALALAPLQAAEVRRMMEDVAPFAHAEWTIPFLGALVERSRGAPQSVLQLVRSAFAAGQLALGPTGWEAPDSAQALAWVDAVALDSPGLTPLSPVEAFTVRLLALWGRAIDERDLIEMLTLESSAWREMDVRRALRHLEELGLVVPRDLEWAVAHDSIVEMLETDALERERGLRLLIGHWTRSPRFTIAILEHLARLCGVDSRGGATAVTLARESARLPTVRASGLRGRGLSRLIANAAGHPEWQTRVYRGIRPLSRLSDASIAAMGVTGTLIVGAAVWLMAMLQPRLVLETEPLADQTGPRGLFEFVVQPRVSLRNGFGHELGGSSLIVARASRGRLAGDTVAALRAGVVQFEALALAVDSMATRASAIELRFSGPWYARDARVMLRGAVEGIPEHEFRLIATRVNGALVRDRSVRAQMGDSLRVDVTFEYTTLFATANYLVGAAPTWGDRERSAIRLAGLPSPVYRGWRSVTFTVPPSETEGPHHLVILFGLEDNVDHMFSSTNWAVGTPRWHDGNDVADVGFAALEELRRTGRLRVDRYLQQGYLGRQSEIRLGSVIVARRASPLERAPRVWLGAAIRIDWAAAKETYGIGAQ